MRVRVPGCVHRCVGAGVAGHVFVSEWAGQQVELSFQCKFASTKWLTSFR